MNIFEVLEINLYINNLINNANTFVLRETKYSFENSEKQLLKIADKCEVSERQPLDSELPEIYNDFIKSAKQDYESLKNEFNASRRIRKLVWALSYKENKKEPIVLSPLFELALLLFQNKWSNNFLSGLICTLLSDWVQLKNHPNGKLLREIIENKLNNYKGERKLLNKIKMNYQYCVNENGGIQLGATFASNEMLFDIDKITTFLGLPNSKIKYSYFEDVCLGFIKTIIRKNKLMDNVEKVIEFLKEYGSIETNKKVLSRIIIEVNNNLVQDIILRDKIKNTAFELIGDPLSEPYWQPWTNATQGEKDDLDKAKLILNEWITIDFINIFFEKLAMDNDRRIFWLKYSKKISKFKIVGSSNSKYLLKNDSRINRFVDARFCSTNSRSQKSAIIMDIKNYILIEYSYKGDAFYAYLKTNPNWPKIDMKHIDRIEDLKDTSMDWIMRIYYGKMFNIKDEGRFRHYPDDEWENYLSSWLKAVVGI